LAWCFYQNRNKADVSWHNRKIATIFISYFSATSIVLGVRYLLYHKRLIWELGSASTLAQHKTYLALCATAQ